MVTINELNRAPAIDATTLAIAESLTDPGGRTHTTELAQTSDNVEQFNTSGTQGTVPISQGDGTLAMEPPEPPSTFSDTEPPVGDAGSFWTQLQNGWSFATVGGVASGIAVDSGTVFVGAGDNTVYALDAATGNEEWSFAMGSFVISGIAVADGTVYVGSDDNTVYAIDASAGTEEWSFSTGRQVESGIAVADGTVYVGSNDNNVYALDASAGTEGWSFAARDQVRSGVAVADGTVFVGDFDGNVYGLTQLAGVPNTRVFLRTSDGQTWRQTL